MAVTQNYLSARDFPPTLRAFAQASPDGARAWYRALPDHLRARVQARCRDIAALHEDGDDVEAEGKAAAAAASSSETATTGTMATGAVALPSAARITREVAPG